MNIGYARTATRGKKLTKQLSDLKQAGISEIFSDDHSSGNIFTNKKSNFQKMLDYIEDGDTLFIVSLDVVSKQYKTLLDFLKDLQHRRIQLKVLNLPDQTIDELIPFLVWTIRNEESRQPRLISIGKEASVDRNLYTFRSKDPEARQTYKLIIGLLLNKKSLREISHRAGVSKATVFRIKKRFEKFKNTCWIVAIFIVTVFTLKAAQSLSDNLIVQVVICAIATVLIVYLSYSDAEAD